MNLKNVAVVGVGAVGVEILRVLKVRKFPIKNLRVFARSAREIDVDGIKYKVEAIEGADFSGIEIALFAGTEGEKGAATQYADKFIKAGAVVIDNGGDFRMKTDVPPVCLFKLSIMNMSLNSLVMRASSSNIMASWSFSPTRMPIIFILHFGAMAIARSITFMLGIFGTNISPPFIMPRLFMTKSTPCCSVIQNLVMRLSVMVIVPVFICS